MKFTDKSIQLAIILLGCLLYIPFLGQVHLFDWDEINFAEASREMILTKDWLTVQINYLPFWEKPPLFIWMQALSMKLFGINEFAARFPNAICGIVTLIVLFRIGRNLLDRYFGVLWTLMYACSILPFIYFKSGIIDPWFNLFIFLGIHYVSRFTLSNIESERYKFIGLSGLFIGLGVLTKGPVALLVFGLVVGIFILIKMFNVKFNFKHVILFLSIFFIVGGFWFILQIVTGNFGIVKDFFVYQVRLFQTKDAGHGGFLLYHFVILFLGVFPASIIALRSFIHDRKDDREKLHEYKNWMMILFWTVLILFTLVKTKIVHYSSLCYFPITFLAAYVTYKMRENKGRIPRWMKATIMIVGLLWALIIVGLQLLVTNKDKIIAMDIIKDPFAVGNLQAQVIWNGYEFLIGVVFIAALTFIFITHKLSQKNQILATLICTLAFTYSTLVIIAPHIEGYSQNAAIEFYKEVKNEDCYVKTIGFKSYADLFYSEKTKKTNQNSYNEEWLLKGEIDKPVYFVMKNTRSADFIKNFPEIKFLYEKNGFEFFKRELKQ